MLAFGDAFWCMGDLLQFIKYVYPIIISATPCNSLDLQCVVVIVNREGQLSNTVAAIASVIDAEKLKVKAKRTSSQAVSVS